MKKIKKYRAGQRLSAKDFNDVVERLEQVEKLDAAYPLKLDKSFGQFKLEFFEYTECIPFILAEDLIPGGSARAYFLNYNIYDGTYISQAGSQSSNVPSFKVYDLYTQFRGKEGYKGICLSLSGAGDAKSHLIISMEQKAEIILFQLADSLSHSDAYQDDCVVLKYFRGKDPSIEDDRITIWNPPAIHNGPYGFAANETASSSSSSSFGWIGWATYDPIEDKYWIIDLEC